MTINWVMTVERHNSPLSATHALGERKYFKEIYNIDTSYPNYMYISKEYGTGTHNMEEGGREKITQEFREKLEADPDYLSEIIEQCYKDLKNVFDSARKVAEETNLEELDNDNLKSIYIDSIEKLYRLMPYQHGLFFLEGAAEDILSKDFNINIDYPKRSIATEMYLKQIKIFADIQDKIGNKDIRGELKNQPKISEEINLFLKEYEWFNNKSFFGNTYELDNFLESFSPDSHYREFYDNMMRRKKESEKTYKKELKKLTPKEQKATHLLNEFTQLRYDKKIILEKGIRFYMSKLLKEVAKRFKFEYDDFNYITTEEVKSLFSEPGEINELKQRSKERQSGFTITSINGKINIEP